MGEGGVLQLGVVKLEDAGVVDLDVVGEFMTELTVEEVAWDTESKESGVWLGFVDALSMLASIWQIVFGKTWGYSLRTTGIELKRTGE